MLNYGNKLKYFVDESKHIYLFLGIFFNQMVHLLGVTKATEWGRMGGGRWDAGWVVGADVTSPIARAFITQTHYPLDGDRVGCLKQLRAARSKGP